MTLTERRRHLIASQKKKNWFDFSKVTGAAYRDYVKNNAYARVDGDKYIANYGAYATASFLYDSRTVLPRGDYVLSFTVYTPTAIGVEYGVSRMSDDLTKSIIVAKSDWTLQSQIHTDYALPFSIDEETTIVLFLKGIGNASNYLWLGYEFTNIRIEKVG